jgi:hypothetical protein
MGIDTDRDRQRENEQRAGTSWLQRRAARTGASAAGVGERREPSEGERRMPRIEQMDRGSRVFLRSPADCVPACQRAVACHIG